MTERKRRSDDGREMDSEQQPPSLTKKRNTAKDEDFQTATAEFDQNAAMLDLESIREFQKEAIWRQMQEYKRDASRAQRQTREFERRQSLWVDQISSVCSLWEKAVDDLDAIVNSGEDNDAAAEPKVPESQKTWLDILMPITGSHSDSRNSASANSLDEAERESTGSARQSLERFNTSVKRVLRQLTAKSSGQPVDWAAAVDRLTRARQSQSELDQLRSKSELLSRQLAEERDLLEQREGELRRALKRLDRSICPTARRTVEDVKAEGSPAKSGAAPGSSSPANNEDAESAAPKTPAEGQERRALGNANGITSSSSAANLQAQQDKADYKILAERRLSELEAKMQESTQLIAQLDALKLQIASVPDHIVAETALYKQALSSRDFYNLQAQRLQVEVERLFNEIAGLKSSRTEFEEGILTETTAQRQSLEAEMQRLQNDLARVRHHRDQIQRELEERRAQDGVEDQKSSELKLLSDVRRERMNALISENKRLLAYVSVLKGDRAAFETYTDDELSKTTAVADELRAKLEQVVRREKKLSGQLEALTVSGVSDEARVASPAQASPDSEGTLRLVSDMQGLRQEIEALQTRVRKYEEILGCVCVDDKGQAIEASGASKDDELVSKQQRIDALTLERDGLVRTSEMMERELQTICDSFAKLEEQNTSKVWDLSAKEQAIARVVAEKSKYEEKFIGLNKDREAQRMANQALRHQNGKQLEHIKAIEERDRMLGQQVALAGNEAQQATAAWQTTQTRLEEAQHRIAELEEQGRALEERARVAAAALGERTESLALMEHEKKRAQEALELANRRMREAEKVTDHTGLAKLCADYKALLKCPTCQTNFKSHALMRCMHVFCKQCIDSRIETRQRKCPSCSEPFGAKDVRQIYL
ncbi:E3 ubiquitin-protein ligase bre1 [Coemansia erecta]|uniref:E3 ubiquitin protein ligase n=1 Tax=Coemansia erecta TaxID=147472 RepID=A0A9W7XYG1_9FUNG|nr:E3 ubiquitin-protein ligase bre1 [Coemansia erecta]